MKSCVATRLNTAAVSSASASKMNGIGDCLTRCMTREQFGLDQSPLGEAEFQTGAQASESVLHTATEINRRRFREIFRRATDLGDGVAMPQNLREHLVVENEIVRVLIDRNTLQHLAGESAITGVV